jgi:hypothetical protein
MVPSQGSWRAPATVMNVENRVVTCITLRCTSFRSFA